MTTTRVELHIRRLELDAATAPSRAALCAAVQAELAACLGVRPARRDRDRAGGSDPGEAGCRPVPADAGLAALARHVALAVLRELGVREAARPRPRAGEDRS
ncbi:hypothetical protein Stsp02_19950 [Streptomyces sp. NBRC 14336]|uniref:hypothetical protein n=1 Tax=Streptomyces sp. NBRC 14336 TaxID=3030992 RepID=UPI0024A47B2F|nr:hypothetical protein [Streptomyces sp. NBRC 14336]GLW46333.1 hypothetical protein Stsp02_19950 [Streptomyces sp. NBRC 14336]